MNYLQLSILQTLMPCVPFSYTFIDSSYHQQSVVGHTCQHHMKYFTLNGRSSGNFSHANMTCLFEKHTVLVISQRLLTFSHSCLLCFVLCHTIHTRTRTHAHTHIHLCVCVYDFNIMLIALHFSTVLNIAYLASLSERTLELSHSIIWGKSPCWRGRV